MKSKRKIASRLLLREYLPFATALVTWLVVAAACSIVCSHAVGGLDACGRCASAVHGQRARPDRRALSAGGRIERAAWARLWALQGAAAFLAVSTTGAFAFWARHTELAIVSAPLFIIGLVRAARAAGMKVCGITTTFSAAAFAQHGAPPDLCCADFDEYLAGPGSWLL